MPRPSAPPAARLRSEQIDLQRADFKRLGVFGDWEHPYLTMDSALRGAAAARASARSSRNGHLYTRRQAGALVSRLPLGAGRGGGRVRGAAPRRPSTSRSACVDSGDLRAPQSASTARRSAAPCRVVIWTTTPWTLPANQAVALQRGLRLRRCVEAAARRLSAQRADRSRADLARCRALQRYWHDRAASSGGVRRARARGPEAAASVLRSRRCR